MFSIALLIPLLATSSHALANVTDCMTISDYNVYELTQNISSTDSSCITITADDVELDCKGYSITVYGKDNKTIDFYNVENITVRNCELYQNDSSTTRTALVYSEYSENVNFYDNNFYLYEADEGDGFALGCDSNCTNWNVYSNTIEVYGNYNFGLFFSDYNNLNIYDNNITVYDSGGVDNRGIHLDGNDSTVYNNNITTYTNNTHGVYITQIANNNTVYNNNIITDAYNSRGVYLRQTSNNNISYNYIETHGDGGYGVYLIQFSNGVQNYNNWIGYNTINVTGFLSSSIQSHKNIIHFNSLSKSSFSITNNYPININLPSYFI